MRSSISDASPASADSLAERDKLRRFTPRKLFSRTVVAVANPVAMTKVVKSATESANPDSDLFLLIPTFLNKIGVESSFLFILQLHGLISAIP